jgi:outer membrane protein assembly factor BamA
MARLPLVFLLLWPVVAAAMTDLDVEEDVADLLAEPPRREAAGAVSERRWAILPQPGYGPETGPEGGIKFEHRDLAGAGVTLDVDGTYALKKQQRLVVSVGWPHGLDDRFLALFRGRYDLDPQVDFFGLGNNDVGPDPASTHLREAIGGDLVFGWRPYERLALNVGVGLARVHIGYGDRRDDTPFTIDRFPDLPGIQGGYVNPFEVSLIWNTRDDVVRPLHGWRGILKVAHTDRALLSDFQFTRYVADLSTLASTANGRHTLAFRLGGAYVAGPKRSVPFWELEELGGDDTLRGFFPLRFRGSGRALVTLEYRGRVTEFDFFHLWHVQIDGVLFGEAGRVFINQHELSNEFSLDQDIVSRVVGDLQYSYGPGIRIVLSQALVARIDVGFSTEETGLVYLAFGQTF